MDNPLQLKLPSECVAWIFRKKKKKKDKEKNDKIAEQITDKDGSQPGVSFTVDRRTKAEIAFARVQEQRVNKTKF